MLYVNQDAPYLESVLQARHEETLVLIVIGILTVVTGRLILHAAVTLQLRLVVLAGVIHHRLVPAVWQKGKYYHFTLKAL